MEAWQLAMSGERETKVTVVGAGLAGTEAALQLADAGIPVRLVEQKPLSRTPAQSTDYCCELVCSNSLRGASLSNAVGLLKEELRRAGAHLMRAADRCRVPAGGALAVDRQQFSSLMTEWLDGHPLIDRVASIVERVPDALPTIIATGPLTGEALAADIEGIVGASGLAYYDAISPVVSADSINWDEVFRASRWGKGDSSVEREAYVNCPMDRELYERFHAELLAAEKVAPRAFEQARYFEGCLPIEVMAERGLRTLSFGPMKPTGLDDPRTGRWPYAVVQLRQEDVAGTAYNIVGFQTRMTWPEQRRVFSMIPGLGRAEFLRYGAVHRNTFMCAPRLLDDVMQLKTRSGLYFAGQLTGTEGYVESAAAGFLCAGFVAAAVRGNRPVQPPETTALGGIMQQLRRPADGYQPSNICFSHLKPWDGPRLAKRAKYEAMAQRALADLDGWLSERRCSMVLGTEPSAEPSEAGRGPSSTHSVQGHDR